MSLRKIPQDNKGTEWACFVGIPSGGFHLLDKEGRLVYLDDEMAVAGNGR